MESEAAHEPVDAGSSQSRNDRQGLELAELSNAMVRLYKEQVGRGPTKARSVYAGSDVVLCTLENSFTPEAG